MPPLQRQLHISHRYLILPVKNGSEKLTCRLLAVGDMVREFSIELDLSGAPDWWAYYDVSAFDNQLIDLVIETDDARAIGLVRLDDELPVDEHLYQEEYRPQFHFTPRRGWNNDPNGLVYLNGEWHMFFQYNPFGIRWGNMHWGHAVSRDLLHWQELPIALYQRSLRDQAYSGGGLVDWNNSSGYGEHGNPPVILAFTSTGRGECLAYSTDQARTFHEFNENPVIKHEGRDPKIFWYAPESKWVMIVFEEAKPHPTAEESLYAIYESPDLKTWTRRSHLTGLWECPELFSLPLDGNQDDIRWVLYGARFQKNRSICLVGHFDGANFHQEYENEISHSGPAFYAAQVFSDAPDQRRVMIGWLAGADYPDMPFSQGMTIPLELRLRSTPSGPRLLFYPVHELESLRAETVATGSSMTLDEANNQLSLATSELLDLELEIDTSGPITLDLRGHLLSIDPTGSLVSFEGQQGHLYKAYGPLALRILIDRSVTEIFVNQGEAAFAAMTLPGPTARLRLDGNLTVRSLRAFRLNSIWK